MMRRLTRVALASAVMAAAMGFSTMARAQVVVLTAKSAGALLKDAKTLMAGASPDPNMVKPFLDMIDGFQAPGALKGIDQTRPLGAYLDFPKEPGPIPFSIVAFVPVTDFDAFLQMMQALPGVQVDAKSNAPGFSHTVTVPNAPPILAMSASGYAFFTTDPSTLSTLKTLKPATLLSKKPTAGDLALMVHMDRIPDQYKQMAIGYIQQMTVAQKEQKPGEDDAAYKTRLMNLKASEDGVMSLLNEGREMSLDLSVDAQKNEAAIEFSMVAKPSTALATSFKKLGTMKTKFRNLAAGSAITAYATMPMTDAARKSLNAGIEEALKGAEKQGLNEDQKAIAKKVIDALKPTLNADTIDLALSIQGPFPKKSGGEPTIAAAVAVAVKGGKKIEAAILDAAKAASPAEKAKISLNIGKAADGTAIHRIKGDKAPEGGQMGEPYVFLAFREDTMVAAFGENGLDVAKKTLDAAKAPAAMTATGSAAAVPQVEMVISASKIAGMMKPEDREKAIAASKQVFAGKEATRDKIRLTLRGETEAVRLRLTSDLTAIKFFATIGGVTH